MLRHSKENAERMELLQKKKLKNQQDKTSKFRKKVSSIKEVIDDLSEQKYVTQGAKDIL
uniref:Uncharacterized protein n=1 Tax=Lepeophtheirus salmonis TaxID=72036 RepID=A0A0K2V1W7_LEPSM